MGDCLLLTGPVRALKEEFPGFQISVLVESRFAACFEGNPDFAEVIPLMRKRSAARLLTRRFNAIINLHGGPTSLAYAWLAWGNRIGLEQYQYRFLYNGLVPPDEPHRHSTERTMAVFRWLGLQRETESPSLRFEVHPREAEKMHAAMQDRPYVVIHPGALQVTKRWDPGRYAEVARTLQNEGFTIALTGGPGEESVIAEVGRHVEGTTILLGLTIPELGELIRGARLYIGNDSGPMHLATAVGTPTVVPWGSSDSEAWRPWGAKSRVIQNPFECNPCPGYRCLVADTPLCIESVSVEQVTAAVREMLK